MRNKLRIFLRKWRPGPKSGPEKGSQSAPKTGSPFGSPSAQKHKEFKGFWSFLTSQRDPVLDLFPDPFGANFETPGFRDCNRKM